jgi:hypothetical protein
MVAAVRRLIAVVKLCGKIRSVVSNPLTEPGSEYDFALLLKIHPDVSRSTKNCRDRPMRLSS